jgi:hypothetical protein
MKLREAQERRESLEADLARQKTELASIREEHARRQQQLDEQAESLRMERARLAENAARAEVITPLHESAIHDMFTICDGAPIEVKFTSPSTESPWTTAHLLDAYRDSNEFEDSESASTGDRDPNSRPAWSDASPECNDPHIDDSDDHAQSVEQYMARLLSENKTQSARTVAQRPIVEPKAEPKRQEAVAEATSQSTHPLTEGEMKPRNAAPEGASSLAAMREIANLNTSTNLGSHTRNHSLGLAFRKAEIAFFSAMCGTLTIYWSNGMWHFQMIGTAALVAAGWWGTQAAISAIKAAQIAKHHGSCMLPELQLANEKETKS